jgi:hypothetical protein
VWPAQPQRIKALAQQADTAHQDMNKTPARSECMDLQVAIIEGMKVVRFVRYLAKSEVCEHMAFFRLIVQIRNLVEALKIVEHAIKEWDDCLAQEKSNAHGFSSRFANYRLATLLAMLYMLDEHVKAVFRPLVRRKAYSTDEFEFWEKHSRGADGFLSLVKNMRASASHVRLPIHSYRVSRSLDQTSISLKMHADTNDEDRTEELQEFGVKLTAFMRDVCQGELVPKFKEILTPAYNFHKSLIPSVPEQLMRNLCIVEAGSGRRDFHAFLGAYYAELEVGLDA